MHPEAAAPDGRIVLKANSLVDPEIIDWRPRKPARCALGMTDGLNFRLDLGHEAHTA
jgi:hypothetical protein